ncbi:hypothetical protein DEO72_LG10g2016 [Vigna unguiculata]|uniref:Uncharacterized protein n=1 Tax=Vigna unguiculata TaxID=3917 RepID=A0A4D6NDG3_VIGUN|nr:hypothetical protein DEO72_LG10g2016 [Vigna unguiculata]
MCHFSQLHVRLSLDDFTIGVLRALNVAPTQLHPNSGCNIPGYPSPSIHTGPRGCQVTTAQCTPTPHPSPSIHTGATGSISWCARGVKGQVGGAIPTGNNPPSMNGPRRVRGWGALGCSNLTASGPGMNGRRRVARDVSNICWFARGVKGQVGGSIPTGNNPPNMNGRRRVRGWGALGCSNLTCSGRGTPGMLQWAYLQAFRILCQSLYLEPTPYTFLYFYDTRPRRPATWLSLISRPSISRLDAFSQSFKQFKDGYFKGVVKEGGKAHFLNADGSTKFHFSWTSNPSRYTDMGMEEVSASDKEVVGLLLKFVDELPTKGLVRVYNSVHPIIDIEGHMAQSGKKNLALFQTLRKEMAAKAKAAGKADVPNLQESVVEVHVYGGTKRKVELPPRPGKGKDVKKIRAALLGTASGAGSASGEKRPEASIL